jgi:hypothetical protein
MSLFTIKTAQANAIVKAARVAKPLERILPKYVALTLAKLELSISDAQGRYEQGKAYAMAKPSQNWKVVKPAPEGAVLESEEVSLWLKVGIKKQELTEDGATELRIPASALIPSLEEMVALIKFIEANPESVEAKAFHAEAIQQATPKSTPKEEGKTGWEYDAGLDTYIAI